MEMTVIMQHRTSEVRRPKVVCKPVLCSKKVPSFLIDDLFPVPRFLLSSVHELPNVVDDFFGEANVAEPSAGDEA